MSDSEKTQLTIDDPMSEEVFKKLHELRALRTQLCEQNTDLDMEKIRLQVAIRQLDQEKDRLFESELAARGIPSTTTVEIDPTTRKISILKPST